jgi:ketosteroid isomerase-like protein
METANKQLLQHVYAEISKGNVQPLLDSLADDVQWTIIGSTALSGTSCGKQEVIDKLLKPIRARLADGPIVFQPERFIAEGEYVVMQARGRATALSGKPYNNTYCIVCRIVDGKLKEMIDYVDTELITTALGA